MKVKEGSSKVRTQEKIHLIIEKLDELLLVAGNGSQSHQSRYSPTNIQRYQMAQILRIYMPSRIHTCIINFWMIENSFLRQNLVSNYRKIRAYLYRSEPKILGSPIFFILKNTRTIQLKKERHYNNRLSFYIYYGNDIKW